MHSAAEDSPETNANVDLDGDDPASNAAESPFAGTPAALLPALQRRGFERLTPVQLAIAAGDDGARDLRITSQTGSGKTVAIGFSLLPGLERATGSGPTTLVIAPTRELAMQIRDELAWLFADVPGASCTVVTGGTSIQGERRQLHRRAPVVVGTPGRLLDHLTNGALDLSQVRQLVLDEADQMLDLGFKDELEGILEQVPAERRTHLMSATFPRAVLELADRFQRDPLHVEGTALDAAHGDIEHVACRIGGRDHYATLVNLLLLTGDERTLVFVRTRERTVTLADKLAGDGFATMPLNGDLAQAQRTRTLTAFRNGTIRTLVATDVAARGLDINSVTMVVHVDLPIDSATYVHRSGRTGRAGQKGMSVLLVPRSQEGRTRHLYHKAGLEPRWMVPPTAATVQARQLERATAAALAAITGDEVASPGLIAAAESLLEDREPAEVVAALLRQTVAATRKPFDLAPQAPTRQQGFAPLHREPTPRRPDDHRPGEPQPGFTRFRINWGFRDGADPRRILAHVCRRGEINSSMVGSIKLEATSSTFEIDDRVGAAFAERVCRRDRRDPHLVIHAIKPQRFKPPHFKPGFRKPGRKRG